MFRKLAFIAVLACAAPALADNVTATGRCVYQDTNGALVPVANATVELRDEDLITADSDIVGPFAMDIFTEGCGSGTSGADGRFTVQGSCGDWFGKPDLYVRCMTMGKAGRIIGSSFPWTLYTTRSGVRNNDNSTYNVGDVRVNAGAGKVWNSINITQHKIQSLIPDALLGVFVMYPGGHQAVIANSGATYFASYTGAIFMSMAAGQEGHTTAHEYGHAMQFESYVLGKFNFDRVLNVLTAAWQALNHATGAGHNFDTKSNPVMAFAEGWAEYHEWLVYGTGIPDCSTWKEQGGTAEADKIQVEGNIACRFQRLSKKWGHGDIWKAQKAAMAAEWPNFFAEYKKIHPDAQNVAVPPTIIFSPILLASKLTALNVATVLSAPPKPTATTFATTLNLAPAVAPAVSKVLATADGSHCYAVNDLFTKAVALLTDACPKSQNDGEKKDCQARLATAKAQSQGLNKFCPTLKFAKPGTLPLTLGPPKFKLVPGVGVHPLNPAVLPTVNPAVLPHVAPVVQPH